jgi:hypothetical protein
MLHASGKATNLNLIVFRLTRSGPEPTIYRIRGEHTNHYTTDAVSVIVQSSAQHITAEYCIKKVYFRNLKNNRVKIQIHKIS